MLIFRVSGFIYEYLFRLNNKYKFRGKEEENNTKILYFSFVSI